MTTTAPPLKVIPYGVADFDEIRRADCAYIDKTQFIETIEAAKLKYLSAFCPWHFGKTLFASTLTAYYDKAAAAKFDQMFAGTYIGRHKTALANHFYVLELDFSGTFSGDTPAERFSQSVRERLEAFFARYPIRGFKAFLKETRAITAPNDLILRFFAFIRPTVKRNLFIIVDEYDHFPNDRLPTGDPMLFKAITEKADFLRKFYAQLKRATSDDGVIARLYITGTASTVLNAVSSDFGIAWDLSEDSRFSSLFGFTETELRSLIPTVINPAVFGHSVDEEVDRMTKCLTAYQFCPFSRTTVFNPADCFYCIDSIKK